MKLILVRHGESEANANHILQGQSDGKLTVKGSEQAKKAGRELKEKYKIDMVFCSPLKRCVETLENILVEYPIEGPVYMCKLLEERDFGEYSEMETQLIDWEEMDQDNKINKELGVESLAELEKRINLFLEDLKLEDENSTILVVSHSGPIKMMISKITGKEFDQISVENTSAIVFEEFK
ncbi:MAG: histidine phosphatase family protein [Candidatus Shapirobacteria bacterium]|nr:histidine phosphatase family protein [Candidatus Shapirobacteria bacterium]